MTPEAKGHFQRLKSGLGFPATAVCRFEFACHFQLAGGIRYGGLSIHRSRSQKVKPAVHIQFAGVPVGEDYGTRLALKKVITSWYCAQPLTITCLESGQSGLPSMCAELC